MFDRHPFAQSALVGVALLLCAPCLYPQRMANKTKAKAVAGRTTTRELTKESDPEHLAKAVTIYRDAYDVPHVFGRTDSSAVFGFAYAQAEDNFWRVEENFIWALGRASELYGEDTLAEDRLNHALEIPRLAREEFHTGESFEIAFGPRPAVWMDALHQSGEDERSGHSY